MANLALLAVLLLFSMGANGQDCSAGPPDQPEGDCCKVKYNPEQEECMKRVEEQWTAFRQSTNKSSFVKTFDMCGSNCFFNNTNVITTDNKINSEEVKEVLEKFLETEWQTLFSSMIEVCKERFDNSPKHGYHGPAKGPMADCNKGQEKLLYCLREQFFVNCPDSSWNNSKDAECNDMRSFVKNCPFERHGGRQKPKA